mgnify:CR=1 FL=1
MKKIGVLGAGSWGTALTWLLTNNGHEVTLWSIMEDEVEMLRTKREHTSKLPGVKLQDSIQLTSNLYVVMIFSPGDFTRTNPRSYHSLFTVEHIILFFYVMNPVSSA